VREKKYVVNVAETKESVLEIPDKCEKNVQIMGNKEQAEEKIVH
jgi:hypothetical protein